MSTPDQKTNDSPHDEIDPLLVIALRALGLPRSMWPGTLSKMTEAVRGTLAATIQKNQATEATREVYRRWQADRRTKIRTAQQSSNRQTPAPQTPSH